MLNPSKTEVCEARAQLFNSTSEVDLDHLFSGSDSSEGGRLLPFVLGRELGISLLDTTQQPNIIQYSESTFAYNTIQ